MKTIQKHQYPHIHKAMDDVMRDGGGGARGLKIYFYLDLSKDELDEIEERLPLMEPDDLDEFLVGDADLAEVIIAGDPFMQKFGDALNDWSQINEIPPQN